MINIWFKIYYFIIKNSLTYKIVATPWVEVDIQTPALLQMSLDKEEEEKIAQEIVQDKSSPPEEAEVTAKVSKKIEMRYFSFIKFL